MSLSNYLNAKVGYDYPAFRNGEKIKNDYPDFLKSFQEREFKRGLTNVQTVSTYKLAHWDGYRALNSFIFNKFKQEGEYNNYSVVLGVDDLEYILEHLSEADADDEYTRTVFKEAIEVTKKQQDTSDYNYIFYIEFEAM